MDIELTVSDLDLGIPVLRMYDLARSCATTFCRHRDDREDMVQTAFLAMWQFRHLYKGEEDAALCFRVGKVAILRIYRKLYGPEGELANRDHTPLYPTGEDDYAFDIAGTDMIHRDPASFIPTRLDLIRFFEAAGDGALDAATKRANTLGEFTPAAERKRWSRTLAEARTKHGKLLAGYAHA